MNNEELKKKIVDILDNKQTHGASLQRISVDGPIKIVQIYTPNEDIANALISAGIGDVKEAEHRALVAERALDLCETAYILSLNHRATEGVSGQAIASDLGIHKFFMEQAEKELAGVEM